MVSTLAPVMTVVPVGDQNPAGIAGRLAVAAAASLRALLAMGVPALALSEALVAFGLKSPALVPPEGVTPRDMPQAEIIRHFNAVIDATDMDIVLYSYPGKDGVEIGYEALDALADNPRIIGIKESSGVMQRAIGISTRYAGRVQLVSGSDDIAWDFMQWGADSWICGPANCMAKPVCEMDAAFRAGDHARAKAIMTTIWPAMNVLESGKFVQKLKYGCELQGNPVGECRLPFGPLTDAEKAEFAAAMQPILNWS